MRSSYLPLASCVIDKSMVDAAQHLSPSSWESVQALQTANAIMDEFRPGNQDSIRRCRKIAESFLGSKFNSGEVYRSDLKPIVYAIGHCHIGKLTLKSWHLVAKFCRYLLVMAMGRNQTESSKVMVQPVRSHG